MNKALICVDFINDIISSGGKLAGKGYVDFSESQNTLDKVEKLQEKFRSNDNLIIHVRVGFSSNYVEHPINSPLFGKAKEFKALEQGAWGTEFNEKVSPQISDKEVIIEKNRVSSFYGTKLDLILRSNKITEVYLCGVSTDLAVESAARDAHDRDYNVFVIADACAAANINDHEKSLETLKKIATLKNVEEL